MLNEDVAKRVDSRTLTRVFASISILEFGCGAGFRMNASLAGEQYCVEYGDSARTYMSKHFPKIITYKYTELLPKDKKFDALFSFSVLEHVECPIQELRELRKYLKPESYALIGIKNEGMELSRQYGINSKQEFHLYTWNSANLGNMLEASGFKVLSVDPHVPIDTTKSDVIKHDFGFKKHVSQYHHVTAVNT